MLTIRRRNQLRSQRILAGALLLMAGLLEVCRQHVHADDISEFTTALDRSLSYYHENCSKHGGYVWRYSKDLRLSEGEAETGPDTIWVQPPGTPSIGMAYVRAYHATGNAQYLLWAQETARALARGQLQSGGWHYGIHFDPLQRAKWGYRDNKSFRASKTKKNKTNLSTLDDDTTTAALRCLMLVDRETNFRDEVIHEAALFGLKAVMAAQRPNGGWGANWHRYPTPVRTEEYPIRPASYPENWSRKWLNDWPGKYYLNDDVMGKTIETMLLAWEVYQDQIYLESAKRGGEFLIAAQMPEPQPAWAQQYDAAMQPCWDRKFEPPAISSLESQYAMEGLLLLHQKTGDKRFLDPFPKALAYLKTFELPDGNWSRFYELKTNKPLYFDKNYNMTYDRNDLPTHYGFIRENVFAQLSAQYQVALNSGASDDEDVLPQQAFAAAQIALKTLNSEGAWIDARGMKGFRKASQEGVIQSETFVANVNALCDAIEVLK